MANAICTTTIIAIMLFRFAILSTILLFCKTLADHDSEELLPSCPKMTTLPKFHQTCNRVAQNSDHVRRQRVAQHDRLKQRGAYPLIPKQRTVWCPMEPVDLSTNGQAVIGQDSRWLVENQSSGSVVVAFFKNGIEYSAMNPSISPPQRDINAILQPGEFKVLHTFEGHVFYVRELLEDGSVGDVLLQHRPGVVEFTNRNGLEFEEEFVINVDEHSVNRR